MSSGLCGCSPQPTGPHSRPSLPLAQRGVSGDSYLGVSCGPSQQLAGLAGDSLTAAAPEAHEFGFGLQHVYLVQPLLHFF